MALGDITILNDGGFGVNGTIKHKVAAGTTASIKAGELVLKTAGDPYVTVWTASNTAKPVVGTDYVAGLSMSSSTETTSAAGYVDILPLVPGQIFLGNPTVAADWDTQAEYDLLVGNAVRLNTTAGGIQSIINDTHGATYGIVIMPLDVAKYPGKVAFALKNGCSYLSQVS